MGSPAKRIQLKGIMELCGIMAMRPGVSGRAKLDRKLFPVRVTRKLDRKLFPAQETLSCTGSSFLHRKLDRKLFPAINRGFFGGGGGAPGFA